jgi:diguanylate cyclase (GGDEF)-like protein/PAS domain S-box-containing protein
VSTRKLLWWFGLWIAGLAAATVLWPELHLYAWSVLGLSGTVAILVGVRRNRPRRVSPWYLLAASLFMFVAGDATMDFLVEVLGQEDPFPSIADVMYLTMYVLVAAAMVQLYRLGVVSRDIASLLDALILTSGVGLLSWIYLISPYISDPSLTPLQKIVSIAYPVCDLLVLAMGARLIAVARFTPAVLMLAGGALGLLVADVAYGLVQLNGVWATGSLFEFPWAACYGLWGAAALHPSMRDVTEPKVLRPSEERMGALLLLALSSLIAPAVLLVESLTGEVTNGLVIAVLSAVLAMLVLVRLSGAVRVHRRAVARERALRRAGASLLAVTNLADVTSVVSLSVARLLPRGRPHREVLVTEGHDDQPADMGMAYTRSLGPPLAGELGDFEVALRCPLTTEARPGGGGHLGTLFVASDEVSLVALQEAAQVLANQAAMALDRIALTREIDRRNSEAYFRTLVMNTADVILIVNEQGRISYASPSATTLLANPNLVGSRLTDIVDCEAGGVVARLEAVRRGFGDRPGPDWRVRRPDGETPLVEATIRDLRDEETVKGLVVTLRDVTESRRLERELYQRATFDAMTALPNREVFLTAAQEAVERSNGDGGLVGVVVVGLDDFTIVNSTMGHATGDELLVAVGQRLVPAMRSRGVARWRHGPVARLGGDEFAILLEGMTAPTDVEGVADRLLGVFAEPFALSQGMVAAAASIGAATTAETHDARELMRQADLAMYVAKGAGKGRWVRYSPDLHAAAVERLELRAELDRAIADGAFELHYQPIVSLPTGHTVAFEALVRWNHPTRGTIPPMKFIDLAEECGLIVPLGSWVLHHAVEAAAQWRRIRPADAPYVSVNASARQFRGADFVEQVHHELAASGLPANSLCVEITESILMHDDGNVEDDLYGLRREGVHIAIDDFGTGFSALSYLRRLPADLLKLDKSFIDTIATAQEQYEVVDAIIRLANTLHLNVVAEGIETRDEYDLLRSMGCGFGQGYLMSRPMSYGDTSRWLLEDTSPVGTGRTAA